MTSTHRQRVKSNGTLDGSSFQVQVSSIPNEIYDNAISMNPAGSIVAIWTEGDAMPGLPTPGYYIHIRGQMFVTQ